MLHRAVQLPCWRTRTPFIRPACVVPRSTPWRPASYGSQLRVFASGQGPLRRQITGDKAAEQKTATASTPAGAQDQKSSQNVTATKNDLLSEASLGNKEQRRADWAIMKEMAKYLWPKVRTRLSGGRAWTERLTGYFHAGRLGY